MMWHYMIGQPYPWCDRLFKHPELGQAQPGLTKTKTPEKMPEKSQQNRKNGIIENFRKF